jgi:nicotinamidase-related amidase
MKQALLLIDIIHDFFHPEGRNYHPRYEDVRKHICALLEAARDVGVPIIHARESHRPGPDFEQPKLLPHCIEGTWDVGVPDWLDLHPEDIEVRKRRYSAFFSTDLDLLLRERGVRRLVVAGVKTHLCVRATIQDAFAYGYEVWLPREATSSNHLHLAEASLEDIDRYFGFVVTTEKALEVLRRSA